MELLALTLLGCFLIWSYKLIQNLITKKASRLARAEVDSKAHKMRELAAIEIKKIQDEKMQLDKKINFYKELKSEFEINYVNGARWLSEFIVEGEKVADEEACKKLQYKKNPAPKAAEQVKIALLDKREALKKCKYLEYQIKCYKETFPFLDDFDERSIFESIDFSTNDEFDDEDADKSALFLSADEYELLSAAERNQLALDRYIKKKKKNVEIGRLYERYVGYLYEIDGWEVDFFGAVKGYEDMGRDLICKKNGTIEIVQAKCWASDKVIHEKHIFQLYGTSQCYGIESSLPSGKVTPVFTTTASLSEIASEKAKMLNVRINIQKLESNYPMIKCNINGDSKIYHLPFDQQYDRVKIQGENEFYAKNVAEAESRGFRRAKKYIPAPK